MTTQDDISAALEAARTGVPAVIETLMSYYKVSGSQLGRLFGVSRQAMNSRLKGTTDIKQEELHALAVFFGVPEQIFYGSPDDALRWVLDHRANGDLPNRQNGNSGGLAA